MERCIFGTDNEFNGRKQKKVNEARNKSKRSLEKSNEVESIFNSYMIITL